MSDPCKKFVRDAAGEDLSSDEIDALIRELRKRQRQVNARGVISDLQEAALKAADELANNAKMAAVIAKRNAAIDLQRKSDLANYVKTSFGDRPNKGLEARLVGIASAKAGSRRSIAAEQRALTGKYLAGLVADLKQGGVHELFASGAMDLDVARALWSIGTEADEAKLARLPKEAVTIARALHKYQDLARVDANKAGAWIRDLKGYVVRQSHDMFKIASAGPHRWMNVVLPKLDLIKTIGTDEPAAVRKFLEGAYRDFAAGVHLKADPLNEAPVFQGHPSQAKKVSQSRVLYFKDADSWFEYNREFGAANLREAAIFGLERLANTTALMRTLGTNPAENLEQVIDNLLEETDDVKGRQKLNEDKQRLTQALLGQLDGTARIPTRQMVAKVGAGLRAWQSMAKLGGAVLSAVTDIPIYASEARYQGRTMLSGMADALSGLSHGRGSAERQQVLSGLGVFFESAVGEITSRFTAEDGFAGSTSRMLTTFFKLNGLTWWTETLQGSAALSFSHNLALNAGKRFDELGDDLTRVLSLYDIDAPRWDLLRLAVEEAKDGRKYLTPEALGNISTSQIEGYLRARGDATSATAVANFREELDSQLRQYLNDRMGYAVIMPDAKTRALALGAERPGTFAGELRRMIAQFKSFPVAVLQRSVAREVYGRGSDSLRQALKNGNGELQGLAQLMVWTTLFGYAAMSLKDLSRGKQPRDPAAPDTWVAAMLQGGSLGIYGDFLLGQSNRFGRSILETVAGPVPNLIADVDEIRARIMAGDDVGATAFRTLVTNTPFLNLFYTRAAVDYLFVYQVQEALNPGYLRRMERRLQRENNQSFILRPTEVVE